MRYQLSKLIAFFLIGLIVCQNQTPYLDIANELLVRKKLSTKLPDVFDNAKYTEVTNKLDNIANIDLKTHSNRLSFTNPEFHWCYAQTYILVGRSIEALDHYRKYKIQKLKSTSMHPLFQKPVNELERALENQQANLAQDIYLTINKFKSTDVLLKKNKILDLQNKLNSYNELNNSSKIITTDGIMGPETKSGVYDFEENNPYFITQGEISSS